MTRDRRTGTASLSDSVSQAESEIESYGRPICQVYSHWHDSDDHDNLVCIEIAIIGNNSTPIVNLLTRMPPVTEWERVATDYRDCNCQAGCVNSMIATVQIVIASASLRPQAGTVR